MLFILAGLLGLGAVVLGVTYIHDTLPLYFANRKVDHFSLASPFELKHGRKAMIDGLWLELEESAEASWFIVRTGLDVYRLHPTKLPSIVGKDNFKRHEIQLVSHGPPLRLEIIRWHGLRLETATQELSWSKTIESESQPSHAIPTVKAARSWAKLVITGHFAFETGVLPNDSGMASDAINDIGIMIRYPDGQVSSHSVLSLQRAVFNAMTGIHPSYKNPAPESNNPNRLQNSAEIAGSFAVDVGVVLGPPQTKQQLKIVASHGPYRSNELQITLQP
ncbi:MAG: hypothetical protein HYV97_18400 [Bdellovibrio sp.]|nr:hypothetical protein [Bdellovibrio sp.]